MKSLRQANEKKMFDSMKNIRKFDFPLDRYDNDPFLKNPLLKHRLNKTKAKRPKGKDKQQAKLVSTKFIILHLCFISILFKKNSRFLSSGS